MQDYTEHFVLKSTRSLVLSRSSIAPWNQFFDNDLYKLLRDDEYDFPAEDDPKDDEDYVTEDEELDDEIDAEEETDEKDENVRTYTGRNGHKWEDRPIGRIGRAAPLKQTIYAPAARGLARNIVSPLELWKLLIDSSIIKRIMEFTNQEIQRRREEREKKRQVHQSYHNPTNETELYALFGLLYILGVFKASMVDANEMWSNRYGVTLYRATMSEQRFRYLLVCLRFDDRTTRETRVYSDNFAAIREVWSKFVTNFGNYYNPSHNMTIDEQFLGFRGNARFRVYMKSKPARYGLKIFMMNDSTTSYMFNAFPYVGQSRKEKEEAEELKKEARRKVCKQY